MSFQEIIQYLVGGQDPICTVSEIAIVMGKDVQTIYGYKNNGTEPTYSAIRALNNYLVREKKCHVIEVQMRPIDKGSKVNGSTLDEMRDMIREMNEVEDNNGDRQYTKSLGNCAKMRRIIDRYENEIQAKQ